MKSYYKLFFAMFLTLSLFSSCITSKKINYLQNSSYKIPKYNDSINDQEYKLNYGDRLFIRVFSTDKKMNILFNGSAEGISLTTSSGSDNADLFTYKIKDDGTVLLPSSGSVFLFGKTIREAKRAIEEAIKPYFRDQYSADVKIVERYFSIIGSTTNGKFPIVKEKMNIFQALALAGDISTYGDRKRIKIIRQTSGSTQIRTFDIRNKDILNSEFYYVQDNDVIYIQDVKEQFFSVTSFSTALSTVFSTLSFGIFIYNIAKPAATTAAPSTSTN